MIISLLGKPFFMAIFQKAISLLHVNFEKQCMVSLRATVHKKCFMRSVEFKTLSCSQDDFNGVWPIKQLVQLF